MSTQPRDPRDAEFAPCRCDVETEDWELQGRISYYGNEETEGVTIVEYQCQTCETFHSTELPSEQV